MNFLIISLIITLLCFGIVVVMLILEQDIFTKIVLVNSATNITVFLICLLGSLKFNGSYFDIAIIYFLLSVIGSAAYLKHFLRKQNIKNTINEE